MTTYSYSNTNGTGDRTGGGGITVTTNAALGGSSGPITRIVNGTKSANATGGAWFTNAQTGKIVTFDFGSGRVIRQCRWFTDSSTPFATGCQWAGSNDNSSFTNIGASHSCGGVGGGPGTQIDTQLIDNTTSYRYYRLTMGTTSDTPWLEEVEFFIDGATDEEGDTSYAYPLGGDTGHAGDVAHVDGDGVNRTSHITATANYVGAGGEAFSLVVDGGTTNGNSYEFANAKTDYVLKFAFDVAQRITAHTLQLSTSTAEGTYTLAGSQDDSSYTTIATGVAFPASSFQEVAYTNTTAYKYYRFTQTSGSTSSTPFVREMYFKLVPTVKTPAGPSGTWASTEAPDVFAGTGAPGAPISAAWASTEAKDVWAGTGYPALTAAMGATEAKDIMAFTAHDIQLDGHATNVSTSTVSSAALTLTTAKPHDVIVVTVTTKGATVSSVADVAGLTWQLRARYQPPSGGNPAGITNMEIWWAISPTALTADVITLTFSGSTKYEAQAFGVCGADTGTPFDTHNVSSVQATNSGTGNPTISITTDFTHDQFIFGVFGSDLVSCDESSLTGVTTPIGSNPAGGTGNLNNGAAYVLKNTNQTNLSISFGQVLGGSANRYLMADAIRAQIDVAGAWASTEAKDVFAGAGYPKLTAAWASVEAKDIFAGMIFSPPRGTWGSTETADIASLTGTTTAPLSVDAHATGSSHDASSASVTLTTTHANDVIVLAIFSGGHWDRAKVGSVTDTAGLTWKKRNQRWVLGDNPDTEIWWAKKPTIGATTITVHTLSSAGDPVGATQTGNTTGFLCVDALAITGANADRPWDTHTGAGWFTDSFGNMRFGTPGDTGTVARYYSNASRGMALAFYSTTGRPSTGVPTAGTDWTWLERVATTETAGLTGTLESSYKVFGARLFDDFFQLTEDTGALGDHSIMQDVIVAANDPNVATVSTDDVIRFFFDGPGQQTIIQLSGTNKSQSLALSTFQNDTVVVVAVMVQSALGARVASVTDDGGHSPGWVQRAIEVGVPGSLSFETWWCHFPTPFTGNITVTLDDTTQAGDLLGFVALGIHGADAFQRGEIWDGDASLPKVNKDAGVASHQASGNFSSLNADVLELNFAANTGSLFADGGLANFNEDPWMQFQGDFFGSLTGLLNSAAPNFNIAVNFKFSAAPVANDHTELNVTPSPERWFMISDVMPVGPAIPPTGVWGSVETKDHTTHTGDFTTIGIASPGGWVGFPPNHLTMTAVDQKDRATNPGTFSAIWDSNGWIGFVPAHMTLAVTDTKDVWASHAWVLGPTTILARWESIETKDFFEAATLFTWYSTPDSKGDRTSRITVTTNAVLGGSSGTPDKLVNGLKANNAASGIWVTNTQPAPMYFRYEFNVARVVNEATWFQTGTSSQPGLWVWQGSNNGTVWTTLSDPFTLNSGNTGSVIGDFSSNQTAYKFYQTIQTTNAGGNDAPWLWEIEFKVAGFSGTMGATEAPDRMNYQLQLIPKADPIPARKHRLLIVT